MWLQILMWHFYVSAHKTQETSFTRKIIIYFLVNDWLWIKLFAEQEGSLTSNLDNNYEKAYIRFICSNKCLSSPKLISASNSINSFTNRLNGKILNKKDQLPNKWAIKKRNLFDAIDKEEHIGTQRQAEPRKSHAPSLPGPRAPVNNDLWTRWNSPRH